MACDFSEKHFKEIIKKLIKHYKFYSYKQVLKKHPKHPFIILRHDVDHSLDFAYKIAKIENRLGVSSNFFILIHSPFYHPYTEDSVKIIREIKRLNHNIGLHYDTDFYYKYFKKPIEGMKKDISILENIIQDKIEVGCMHNVVDSPLDKKFRQLLPIDVCHPAFFNKMTYLSDSAMTWRKKCICQYIGIEKKLHLTLHPLYWVVPGKTMYEKFKKIILIENKKNYTKNIGIYNYYQSCLKMRKKLDKKVAKHFKKSK